MPNANYDEGDDNTTVVGKTDVGKMALSMVMIIMIAVLIITSSRWEGQCHRVRGDH